MGLICQTARACDLRWVIVAYFLLHVSQILYAVLGNISYICLIRQIISLLSFKTSPACHDFPCLVLQRGLKGQCAIHAAGCGASGLTLPLGLPPCPDDSSQWLCLQWSPAFFLHAIALSGAHLPVLKGSQEAAGPSDPTSLFLSKLVTCLNIISVWQENKIYPISHNGTETWHQDAQVCPQGIE